MLGALVLPLFGLSLGGLFGVEESAETGYQYGYEQPAYGQAYGSFAKRHGLDFVAPVLSTLTKGKKKYEGEEEEQWKQQQQKPH